MQIVLPLYIPRKTLKDSQGFVGHCCAISREEYFFCIMTILVTVLVVHLVLYRKTKRKDSGCVILKNCSNVYEIKFFYRFNHFKVCESVILGTFTAVLNNLCNCYDSPFPELFIIPNRNSVTIKH